VKRALALVAVAMALAAILRPNPSRQQLRPNIVLILIDTLRRDHLPFYGYPTPTAPFLSELAEHGVVFEHAHSTSSWTPPATASLFTSLYPFQHGVLRGFQLAQRLERLQGRSIRLTPVPGAAETLAEALSRRGYRSFAITENPNLVPEMGFAQGFRQFSAFPKNLDAETILKRLGEIRAELTGPHPYFLYLHFMDVHAPYRARPPLFDDSLADEAARKISAYDSGIRSLDERLREAFAACGWARNTLLLVTADHGEELGDRGSWGHGATLFGEVLDVPLLVYPPGGAAPRRCRERVSLIDILPTLREVAGLPPAAADRGVSLLGLIEGRGAPLAPRVLFAHLWRGTARDGSDRTLKAAIEGDWKWIGGDALGARLFQLSEDPAELVNRARDEPERALHLRDRYRDFEARSRKYSTEGVDLDLDSDALESLKALGYVN
jgi:arylsulfatase A-like enzyme